VSTPLLSRLDMARGALRRSILGTGIARLLALVIGLLAAFFIVDWLAINRILPLGFWDTALRLPLTVAVVLIAAWQLRRELLTEWRLQRSDDDIALRVEHTFRDLGGRLISSVQLERSLDEVGEGEPESQISAGMIEGLVADTETRVRELDFQAIIDRRPFRRGALIAVVCLLAALGLSAWKPGYATALAARFVLLPVGYPTATRILAVHHAATATEGQPFPIEIEVDPAGHIPDRASVTVRFANDREVILSLDRVEDAADGKVIYRGQIAQALVDFRLRPIAYDHRWPSWDLVPVVRRPAVVGVSVTSTYPSYLDLPPTTAAVGDLRVPEGTVVAVSVTTTKPIATAALVLGAGFGAEEPREEPLLISEDGLTLTGTFQADANGTWSLGILDRDGLAPLARPTYTVSVVPDREPVVVIERPEHDKLASPRAVWPLRFTVKDDHGIGQGWLRYRLETSGEVVDDNALSVAVPLPGLALPGETAVVRETVFDLGRLGVQPGQRVVYWLEVADNRTPEPKIGVSAKQRFMVLDDEALRAEIERQRAELFERISLIRERQKDARDAVDDLLKKATDPAPMPPKP